LELFLFLCENCIIVTEEMPPVKKYSLIDLTPFIPLSFQGEGEEIF